MIQISFNYNEDTNIVENIVVRNLCSKTDKSIPTVEVKENKLVISPKAISMLGCVIGDRISINYYQENSENTYPVIGRSSLFADDDSGNKLTKSNTVSFKGFQKNVLLKYGSEFILEEFRDGIFKLVPSNTSFDIRKVL